MTQIRIGIVDDDNLIVNLVAEFLREKGIVVSLVANDGQECLEKLSNMEIAPEILLLDLKMKGMSGVELMEHLRPSYPAIKTIVMSSHYRKSFMGFMIKSGVAAFIPKGVSPKDLLHIVHEVSEKGFYFQADQVESMRDQISTKSPKPILETHLAFTTREIEVLELICRQKTAKEIGEKLHITQRTVEGHKTNLFAKTGAKNMAGLVIFAVQYRLIELKDFMSL